MTQFVDCQPNQKKKGEMSSYSYISMSPGCDEIYSGRSYTRKELEKQLTPLKDMPYDPKVHSIIILKFEGEELVIYGRMSVKSPLVPKKINSI